MNTFTNFEYYRLVLEALDEGVLFISNDFSIDFANSTASSILKISTSKLMENTILDFFPNLEMTLIWISNSLDSYSNLEYPFRGNNLQLKITPLVHNLDFKGYLILLKDQTELINKTIKLTLSDAAYTFSDIIGNSPALQKVISDAKNISKSPSTVLITGESGCGKELLAQSIHNDSLRIQGPFVAVNCGALPKSLIESELFGYEEGTFTGARRGGKPGKFELANGGTIFLDEIGEMPLEMQVHLLRVIQEGTVMRVGGKSSIPIDIRIIAATNRDLKEEIKKGTFRNDLYYRLNVIPLHIPPLKDRIGDVPILIDYFLKVKSNKLKKPIPKISNVLFKKMLAYCWPGNIRELENCVENIVNLNGMTSYEMNFDECVCLTHDNLGNPITHNCEDSTCAICNNESSRDYIPRTLIELEIEAIKEAIEKNNHNMTKASASLGISRNALYNKIKRYGISN